MAWGAGIGQVLCGALWEAPGLHPQPFGGKLAAHAHSPGLVLSWLCGSLTDVTEQELHRHVRAAVFHTCPCSSWNSPPTNPEEGGHCFGRKEETWLYSKSQKI